MSSSEEVLRREALDTFLQWVGRCHPSDIQLRREDVGPQIIGEFLYSICEAHFSEEFMSSVADSSDESPLQRIAKIRKNVYEFYKTKQMDLNNAPSFFVSASEILSKDEDALLRFLVVLYGIPAFLKNQCVNTFSEILGRKSDNVQTYVSTLVRTFTSQLTGESSQDVGELRREMESLRQRLQEKSEEVMICKSENAELKAEIAECKEELDQSAKTKLIADDLETREKEIERLQSLVKSLEEMSQAFENEKTSISRKYEQLIKETEKLKAEISELSDENRYLRDEAASIQHQLSISAAKAKEMEDRFVRLKDSQSQKPSERDYNALKDRYDRNLKLLEDQDQIRHSLESAKSLLKNREAEVAELKEDRDAHQREIFTLEQRIREMKKENRRLHTTTNDVLTAANNNSPPLGNTSPVNLHEELQSAKSFDFSENGIEVVELKSRVAQLESQNRTLTVELDRLNEAASAEKSRAGEQNARARKETDDLALSNDAMRNELQRLRSELATAEFKQKKSEEQRDQFKSTVESHELALQRAAVVIAEYTSMNEDGTATGISGGELLQLKAELRRAEQQCRQSRLQHDAYRHTATEEQRLITAEWYERAVAELQRRVFVDQQRLAAAAASAASISNTADIMNESTASFVSAQSGWPDSTPSSTARSTPQPFASPSVESATTSSTASTLFHKFFGKSFLGAQRDVQPSRTPARWGDYPNAQTLPG